MAKASIQNFREAARARSLAKDRRNAPAAKDAPTTRATKRARTIQPHPVCEWPPRPKASGDVSPQPEICQVLAETPTSLAGRGKTQFEVPQLALYVNRIRQVLKRVKHTERNCERMRESYPVGSGEGMWKTGKNGPEGVEMHF